MSRVNCAVARRDAGSEPGQVFRGGFARCFCSASVLDGVSGKRRNPTCVGVGFLMLLGSLTMTYFHTGNPHYHRRGVVSRSCSGWEGVGPTRYDHQA